MIKNHLSKLMGEKRITITDVAKSTGMSASTISNLYNEKVKRLDFDTLEKLCEFFNCNIQDIIEYIPNKDLSK